MSPYWSNILLLIGTTVGAGIFSLPVAIKQTGSVLFLVLLLVLSLVMMRVNYFYAAVVSKIKTKHQLAGHVGAVFGPTWKKVASVIHISSLYGTLIAFCFIGGTFLSQIIPLSVETSTMLFYGLTVVCIFTIRGLETLDKGFSLLKVLLFAAIIAVCAALVAPGGEIVIPIVGDNPHLAYGIILFSLTGFSIIPELHKEGKGLKSLAMAQVIISVLYLLFTFLALPFVNGTVYSFPHPLITLLFNVTGFVSVFSSCLIMCMVGKDMFMIDFKLAEKPALGAIMAIPFFAVVFQVSNFLKVLSLTGAVFLGGTGLLICMMYAKLFPGKNRIERIGIELVLLLGVIIEILIFLKN